MNPAETVTRPLRPPGTRRAVAVASIGNALEWYDWNVYATFTVLLGARFFPPGDTATEVLETLAVFAVGFFFRPLGGAVIGAFTDRFGRRAGLTLSILLMAAGSLIIAITPSYQDIGVLAPLLLVLSRAAQGLSSGGEVTAMSTYINEIAPPKRRGFYSSAIYISTTAGTLAATLLGLLLRTTLTPAQLADWGWRLPFALGALAAFYGWYLRRGLAETGIFDAAPRVRRPAFEVLRRHPAASLRVVGFTLGITVVYYTFGVYLPTFAQTSAKLPAIPALWASVGAQLVFVLSLPVLGMLSDRYGRRPLLLVFGIGSAIGCPLFLSVAGWSPLTLFIVMSVALVLFGCCAAAGPPAMLEMFPTEVRASGIGLPYSLTVALFGGTAPYLIEFLSTHGLGRWYQWYVVGLCLISTVVFWRYRETKDVDLGQV